MASQPAKKTDASPKSAPSKAVSGDPMDVERLERLVALMAEAGLTSLELQDGEKRISLSRGGPAPAAPVAYAPAAAPVAPAAPASPAAPSTAGLKEIPSPMVGTFYTAPKPGAAAFVAVGGQVSANSDVCIIEAMKVFNTIKADIAGTIEKILVADGEAVEFGQPLFLVKP